MNKPTRRKGTLWIVLGLLLITAALFLAAYNLYDARRAGRSVQHAVSRLEAAQPLPAASGPAQTQPTLPDYVIDPTRDMPVQTIDGRDYIGLLRIPALELELPILSQWSYPDLKVAPCRYTGSAYLDSLVICGHNYQTHFGRLKTLQPGDEVTFTDLDGNVFSYQVAALEVLAPDAVDAMTEGDWDLTLFTCTVGGRSRVTVRCVRLGF